MPKYDKKYSLHIPLYYKGKKFILTKLSSFYKIELLREELGKCWTTTNNCKDSDAIEALDKWIVEALDHWLPELDCCIILQRHWIDYKNTISLHICRWKTPNIQMGNKWSKYGRFKYVMHYDVDQHVTMSKYLERILVIGLSIGSC